MVEFPPPQSSNITVSRWEMLYVNEPQPITLKVVSPPAILPLCSNMGEGCSCSEPLFYTKVGVLPAIHSFRPPPTTKLVAGNQRVARIWGSPNPRSPQFQLSSPPPRKEKQMEPEMELPWSPNSVCLRPGGDFRCFTGLYVIFIWVFST